jgi:mannitol/fructose-specific phosphotransferase system IIA component
MKTTLNEYLGLQGLDSPLSDYMIDKMRIPHGQTLNQEKQMIKESRRYADEYYKRRNAAIADYNEKVKSGEIIEKSNIEQMIERANGHPDNESTQAARRRCEKKGINWMDYAK